MMKTFTLTQSTKQHNLNKLHDAFIAATLSPLTAQGDPGTGTSTFTFDDAVTDQSIQNVVTAYVFAAPVVPPDIKVLWQAWLNAASAATTIGQMKTAMANQLNDVLKAGFKATLGDV
jgi:hypothetical protein